MFGYVIADLARLDEGQQTRYKSFYCGCAARCTAATGRSRRWR